MNALVLWVLLSQVDPLQKLAVVQVTGWSADESKFSVRGFELEESEEAESCPGYVDHQGKPFKGKLVVAAYDRGTLLHSWVVQDYPTCTPPAKAKEALTKAKAKLQELGIDLNLKGTLVPCATRCDVGHGAQLLFENGTKKTIEEDELQGTLKGTLRVVLQTAKGRAPLFEKSIKERYGLAMGGDMFAQLRPVERSPKGDAFVARVSLEERSGRGGSSTQLPVGYYAWNGEAYERGGVPKSYIAAPAPK